MKAIRKLHELGQSLWVDHATHKFLESDLLKDCIKDRSLTGLVSNPAATVHTINTSTAYDGVIRKQLKRNIIGEELYFEIEMERLRRAADLFRPIFEQTDGFDGYVSLAVSPLISHDSERTMAAVRELYRRVRRPNILITIPGTRENLSVIEEAIFLGVPINASLLFSHQHYLAAAEAFIRGIERRIAAGLSPKVGSVASLSINPWDTSVKDKVPDALSNQLGVAIARHTYIAYQDLQRSKRWERAQNAGARFQRLLWAGTDSQKQKTQDPFYYIRRLTAAWTINTVTEKNLQMIKDNGDIGALMQFDGNDYQDVFVRFANVGVDIDSLAVQLQNEAMASLIKMWIELLMGVAAKSAALV